MTCANNQAQSKPRGSRASFKNLREACELLGIRDDADQEIVEAAYRVRARKAHPDAGGTVEQMERLNQARDLVYGRRGWARNGAEDGGNR